MTVSIIIPAYNAAAYLPRSIEAAIRAGSQVQGRWELILVDNGSTDATPEIIAAAAEAHPDTVVAAYTARRGAPAARNHGTALSSGEWLQFLDADDTIAPEKIAHQLSLAGDADWVIGAYRHLFTDGMIEDTLPHPDPWRGLFHNFRTGHTISNLLRRSALDRVGGWDESLSNNQDPDLHFRLLREGVPYVLDNHIASFYHHHDGQRITGADLGHAHRNRANMLAAAIDHLHTHLPSHWAAHSAYFLGGLLATLRRLATYDLRAATTFYRHYFDRRGGYTSSHTYPLVPRYARLYPYLGFGRLEWLRTSLATVLPRGLKDLLKS